MVSGEVRSMARKYIAGTKSDFGRDLDATFNSYNPLNDRGLPYFATLLTIGGKIYNIYYVVPPVFQNSRLCLKPAKSRYALCISDLRGFKVASNPLGSRVCISRSGGHKMKYFKNKRQVGSALRDAAEQFMTQDEKIMKQIEDYGRMKNDSLGRLFSPLTTSKDKGLVSKSELRK